MPQYTRYLIDVKTVVQIRTNDEQNRLVADFTVSSNGSADSDKHPLQISISDVVQDAAGNVEHYAEAVAKVEKERLS